jgi:hypothetical protein
VNSPPARGPATQEAAGAGPRGKATARKPSLHVPVVNAPWNGSGYIKRKKAEFYVKAGRAIFVGNAAHPDRNEMIDQLRLIDSHPDNIKAAATAALGYEAIRRNMTIEELSHLPMMRPRIAYTDRSVTATRHVGGRSGRVRIVSSSEANVNISNSGVIKAQDPDQLAGRHRSTPADTNFAETGFCKECLEHHIDEGVRQSLRLVEEQERATLEITNLDVEP